jgi:hypothetical protein
MRYAVVGVPSGSPRARLGMAVLALAASLAAGDARGDMFASVGPTTFEGVQYSGTANPYPAIAVSTITSPAPGECTWINTGLAAFAAANPADGSGPSGQGWSFTWAGVQAEAAVEAGIRILDYYPYVVTQPEVLSANETVFPARAPDAVGGAVFNLEYLPQPVAPAIANLHWIQAYTGVLRGMTVPTLLDNDPFHPYTAQDDHTPFYDQAVPSAGTLEDGGGWFTDRPVVRRSIYEMNPVASIQFQVIIADDVQTMVKGVTQNAVTLYGGEWWGFTFSAVDVPEPSALVLLALGGPGLLLATWRRWNRVCFLLD